jgi:hypothetical protein
MIHGHAIFADPSRWMMALAVFTIGLWAFLSPDYFWGLKPYIKCSARKLSPDERDRLERTMMARQAAEGVSKAFGRWLGLFGIAIAALTLVPAVPIVVPYALFSLAIAATMLLGYLQFQRATVRRVAPLLRRSALRALPPGAIVAMVCCFVATLSFAIYPALRVGAIVAALVTLVLGVIAWRIAGAPALLLGVDPQVEYAVDERVRAGRATSIAYLACAPAFVFVVLSTRSVPPQDYLHAMAVQLVVMAAFIGAGILAVLSVRRRIRVA